MSRLSRPWCRIFGHRWDGLVCTRTACRGRVDATRLITREALRRHDAEMLAFIRGHYGVTVRPPEDFTRIDGGSGS